MMNLMKSADAAAWGAVAAAKAAVKVELDVEGLPAPPLPGYAPASAGVTAAADAAAKSEVIQVNAEVNARQATAGHEVKVEQVKVEVKSEVKYPQPPPGKRARAPAEGRRDGAAAAGGGAFCRRSSHRP